MARTTYVLRDGDLIERHLAAPLHAADRAAPYVQSDTMDPIRSMADGRVYDSKSAYRSGLRARGCIEVGNERAPFQQRREYVPTGVAADISRAIDQLRSR